MTPSPTQRPTVAQSLAADHRKMILDVTAGHTLDFLGGGHRMAVTAPGSECPLRFADLRTAYLILQSAEGATAALMAQVFGVRA